MTDIATCPLCGCEFERDKPEQLYCCETAEFAPTQAEIAADCYAIRKAKGEVATGDLR